MAGVGFKMTLKPGNEVEYKERHDEVWPEMLSLLSQRGIRNYSIYRDALTLFAYLEIDDPCVLDNLPREEVVRKWWRYMEPLMECNGDSSPVMNPLEEVFHMD